MADLSRADLSGANLNGANLSRADLSEANLSWANLSGANLSGASLKGANLSGAKLRGANLSGADFINATLNNTAITDGSLSSASFSKEQSRHLQIIIDKKLNEKIEFRPSIFLHFEESCESLELVAISALIYRLQELKKGCLLNLVLIEPDKEGTKVEIVAIKTGGHEIKELRETAGKLQKELQNKNEIIQDLKTRLNARLWEEEMRKPPKWRGEAGDDFRYVLSMDVKGFTDKDDIEQQKLTDFIDNNAGFSVENCDGVLINLAGDGILAVFDGVNNALLCGFNLKQHLEGEAQDVRTAITYGQVRLKSSRSSGGADASGEAINRAERLQSAVGTGSVYIDTKMSKDEIITKLFSTEEKTTFPLRKKLGKMKKGDPIECHPVRYVGNHLPAVIPTIPKT